MPVANTRTFMPLSASFRVPIICISVKRDRFIDFSRLQYAKDSLLFNSLYYWKLTSIIINQTQMSQLEGSSKRVAQMCHNSLSFI